MLAKLWSPTAARVLSTALIFLLALGFLRSAHETIILFLLAIFFAYLVDPVVSFLQPFLGGRGRAITLFYLVFLATVSLLGFFFGSGLVQEGQSLIGDIPSLVERLTSGQFILTLGHDRGWEQAKQLQLQQMFMSHRTTILNFAEGLAAQLEAPLKRIWWLVLLAVFFLKNGASMADEIAGLGQERRDRSTLQHVFADVHTMLGEYIRAQLILAALTGCALTLVLGLMHVPYAFILSPLAGLCEFIPVVGPAVACVAIFVIALALGYNHLLWVFLVLGTWRIIQDYFNAPSVMGKTVGVSPVTQIFVVLAGGEIAGVGGALAAVPLLATFSILWKRLGKSPRRVPQERDKSATPNSSTCANT